MIMIVDNSIAEKKVPKKLFLLIMLISSLSMVHAQIETPSTQDTILKVKDYAYFKDEYRDASINFHVGVGMLAGGIAGMTGGIFLVSNNDLDIAYGVSSGAAWGVVLISLSTPAIIIGTVLTLNGAIRRDKARKAM